MARKPFHAQRRSFPPVTQTEAPRWQPQVRSGTGICETGAGPGSPERLPFRSAFSLAPTSASPSPSYWNAALLRGPCPEYRDIGVAPPTQAWHSGLALRRAHHEPVERGRDLDLARQPRIRAHVETEIQHVLLHWRRLSGLLAPRFVDIDVAGRAGAGTSAFGLDAGNAVLNGCLHDGRSRLGLDRARRAGMIDIGDLDHSLRAREMPQPGRPGALLYPLGTEDGRRMSEVGGPKSEHGRPRTERRRSEANNTETGGNAQR